MGLLVKSCLMTSGAARGGQNGQALFWAVFFPVRANPLRKNFRGYTPRPPANFCRFVLLMKQAVKMYCLTCEFFCFKHKLIN